MILIMEVVLPVSKDPASTSAPAQIATNPSTTGRVLLRLVSITDVLRIEAKPPSLQPTGPAY